MLDLLGNVGDFPGVCTPNSRELYELACPSPLLLLNGDGSLDQSPLGDLET